MAKVCSQCRRSFEPHPSSPHQECCGDPNCRRSWKAKWQREKRAKDKDYRDNQTEAQKQWRQRNPGYSTSYRKRHPDYAERNRKRQRERNRLRQPSEPKSISPVIGKMDRLTPDWKSFSGVFRLVPLGVRVIGKMDSALVEIRPISGFSSSSAPDAK